MLNALENTGHIRLTEGRFPSDPGLMDEGPAAREWLRRILDGMTEGLLRFWRRSAARPARLALIERIPLGPKQSLLLVEADGVRLLVATSSDAAAAFFPLQGVTSSAPVLDRAQECASHRTGDASLSAAGRAEGGSSW